MRSIKSIVDPHKEIIEIVLSGSLFISLIISGNLFTKFDFFNIVYALLAYIVILELTRMVGQYLFAHQKQIRTIIDTFIIFVLREIILTYSDKSMGLELKSFYIVSGFIIMLMLFYFRKKAMTESPYENYCSKCLSNDSCATSQLEESR
jgi:uncharacterized membrane protein (DUF373 family)